MGCSGKTKTQRFCKDWGDSKPSAPAQIAWEWEQEWDRTGDNRLKHETVTETLLSTTGQKDWQHLGLWAELSECSQ